MTEKGVLTPALTHSSDGKEETCGGRGCRGQGRRTAVERPCVPLPGPSVEGQQPRHDAMLLFIGVMRSHSSKVTEDKSPPVEHSRSNIIEMGSRQIKKQIHVS